LQPAFPVLLALVSALFPLPGTGEAAAFVPVLLPPAAAAGAPTGSPEAALDVLVLGFSPESDRVLLAERKSETAVTLRLVDRQTTTLEAELVRFQSAQTAPAFEPEALLRQEKTRAFFSRHGLKPAPAAFLSSTGKAQASLRFAPEGYVLSLVTSAGEMELLRLPTRAAFDIRSWFSPDGKLLVLAGWRDDDGTGDGGPTGVFQVAPAAGETALDESRIVEILVRDARSMLDGRRFARAAEGAAVALSRQRNPATLELAALALAYAQNWKESAAAYEELARGKEASSQEAAARLRRSPLVREALLRMLDIGHDKTLTFKAAKGFEGTTVWVKVKDSTGRNIAIFKPTNGNTYHRGEVFTYQMAKILGIEEMYPVTILHTLDAAGCKKLEQALSETAYKGPKEGNRKLVLQRCRKGQLEGAVKEWVLDFQFYQAIGKSERLKKSALFRHLTRDGAFPEEGKMLKVTTKTRLYKPDNCKSATYLGNVELAGLARDLSDMLVMDVLNANEDRFPGANVHFKSLGTTKEVKTCEFDFGESRLYSLDNGATFKGTYSNGFVDFTKRLKPTRFHRRTFYRLKAIADYVDATRPIPFCLSTWGIRTREDLVAWLALDKGDEHPRRKVPFSLFDSNLRSVLKVMRKFEGDSNAWFK